MEDQASELRELMKNRGSHIQVPIYGKSNDNHKTRIIAVTSGKGGVGKTNISVNMAIGYAQIGKKVILIDGDLGMANVNILLGVAPKSNLLDVMNGRCKMKDILCDTEYGFKFVPGANGFSSIANLSEDELSNFSTEFMQLSDADIIIIDTGAGVAQNVLSLLVAADEIHVVTTAEPTSITDAYGIIKIIATEMMDNRPTLKILINRVHSATEGKRIAEQIISIALHYLNYEVEYLGFIYDDPTVSASVLRQKPFMIAQPNAKCSMCIRHMIGRIENTDVVQEEGFSRFFRKFKQKR